MPASLPSLVDDPALDAVRAGRKTLRRGSSEKAAVTTLQRGLAAMAFPVTIDGAFGPQTERIVKVLQIARKKTADGIVGKATLEALRAALASLPATPAPIGPAPPWTAPAPLPNETVAGILPADRFVGRLALSFDDGPKPGTTDLIQDILVKAGVPATFYCTGQRASEQPALLRRHRDLGFAVGQHSWDHPEFSRYDDVFVADQLDRTNAALAQILGQPGPFPLRPPYGSPWFGNAAKDVARRAAVSALLRARGMDVRMWQIDTWDWSYSFRPWEVVRTFRAELARAGGGVVLMHDIQPQTVEALPGVLDVIRQSGLPVVRETELLATKYGL